MQKTMFKLLTIAAAVSLSASMAMAQGIVKMTFGCPEVGNNTSDDCKNYGSYLLGTGHERIDGGATIKILFQGPVLAGSNLPADLDGKGYFNAGASYSPTTGGVICRYRSHMGYDSFAVSYLTTNALNGVVTFSDKDTVKIKIPAGYR